MSVLLGCICPHPPILVPEVGGKEVEKIRASQEAMEKLGVEVSLAKPESFIIISPHSPVFSDSFGVKSNPCLEGSLAQFGAPQVSLEVSSDLELTQAIFSKAQEKRVPLAKLEESSFGSEASFLDHGILVPLYYLYPKVPIPLVSLSISYLSYEKHYQLGKIIRGAVETLGKKVVFIASGDLSHRLIPGAPAGYSPRGKEFDLKIKEILEKGTFADLFSLEDTLIEGAGECGLRSIITLAGLFEAQEVETQVLSYEGPFGVGYLVALIKPDKSGNYNIQKGSCSIHRAKSSKNVGTGFIPVRKKGEKEIPPLELARQAVESYIRDGNIINPLKNPPPCLRLKAGTFVSLKKKGTLRGCIGTTIPTQENTAQEIIKNAIHSATQDPRFLPVEEEELADLDYSVDILGKSEEISGEKELDPKTYGVIVVSGLKTGLLLPNLEGVNTVEQQLKIARQKAGIKPEEKVKIYRFKVQRYH